jgi:translation initiation factor 4E
VLILQDFWRYSNTIKDVSLLPEGVNVRLFKAGIKPTWEDPANYKGGKWVINATRDNTHQTWIKILLAVVGEQFENSDQIVRLISNHLLYSL